VIGSRKAGFVNLVLRGVQQEGYWRLTDFTVPPGSPGIRPTLDLQCQGARWARLCGPKAGVLVHDQPRHSQRNLCAPADSAWRQGFRMSIVTAKNYFSEEKRDGASHGRDDRRRRSCVPAGQHLDRWPVPDLQDGFFPIRFAEVVLQEIHFEALVGALSDYEGPLRSSRLIW